MIEYESEPQYTYSVHEIADRLLPSEKNHVANERNKEYAERVKRDLARIQDEGSAYVPGDLIAAVETYAYGHMGEVIAHTLNNTKTLNEFNDDAKRILLQGALESDIAVFDSQSKYKYPLPLSADIFPVQPKPEIKAHIRRETLSDLRQQGYVKRPIIHNV